MESDILEKPGAVPSPEHVEDGGSLLWHQEVRPSPGKPWSVTGHASATAQSVYSVVVNARREEVRGCPRRAAMAHLYVRQASTRVAGKGNEKGHQVKRRPQGSSEVASPELPQAPAERLQRSRQCLAQDQKSESKRKSPSRRAHWLQPNAQRRAPRSPNGQKEKPAFANHPRRDLQCDQGHGISA